MELEDLLKHRGILEQGGVLGQRSIPGGVGGYKDGPSEAGLGEQVQEGRLSHVQCLEEPSGAQLLEYSGGLGAAGAPPAGDLAEAIVVDQLLEVALRREWEWGGGRRKSGGRAVAECGKGIHGRSASRGGMAVAAQPRSYPPA